MAKCAEAINEISPEKKISPEVQQKMQEFPNLLIRKGRVKIYEMKIEIIENAIITQQKGRRIPIQLHDRVDSEIEKLLKDGHIANVDKIQDNDFIQPTAITVKKRTSL